MQECVTNLALKRLNIITLFFREKHFQLSYKNLTCLLLLNEMKIATNSICEQKKNFACMIRQLHKRFKAFGLKRN